MKRTTDRRAGVPWLVLLGLLLAPPARGQAPGPLGFGLAVGSPGGVSVRSEWGRGTATHDARFQAVSALVSFDFGGYLLAQGHLEREFPVPDSPVRFYAGPGLATGVDGRSGILGLAAVGGMRFYRGRTEVFVQLHPRVTAWPSRRFEPGGGVGFRYYP